MSRVFLLFYLSLLLIFMTESKPVKKKTVKKTIAKPVKLTELKKDTISGYSETQKNEISAKVENANGLIANNTTYYYTNKIPSVKVGDWHPVAGKSIRKIYFYDKNGKQTFELTDEFASYSVVTYIHFRQDGSVEKAEVHENPGASRYTYLITIRFTENNMPVSKYKSQNPPDMMKELQGSGKSLPAETWDTINHIWIKPEPAKIKGMYYENGIYINDNFSLPKNK